MSQKIKYKMNNIKISKYTPKKFDVLLTGITENENRSYRLIEELYAKETVINNIIVLDYDNQKEKVEIDFNNSYSSMLNNTKIISVSKENENDVLQVKEILKEYNNDCIIGIDISSVPVPQFFLLLKIVSLVTTNIYVYYTEPLSYIMDEGVFESYFSTKGPITTKEIPGFPGITVNENDSTERTLFCILGFDTDLLPSVIQEAAPRRIIPINGFPSFYPKYKDISLSNNEKVLGGSNFVNKFDKSISSSNYVYVEANNPFDAYNRLEELKQKCKNNCIDIVPLGTKPMALGVCLYAIRNKDIRVIYPFPEEYIKRNTEESKNTWEYVIS